jgi:hypothetical protein
LNSQYWLPVKQPVAGCWLNSQYKLIQNTFKGLAPFQGLHTLRYIFRGALPPAIFLPPLRARYGAVPVIKSIIQKRKIICAQSRWLTNIKFSIVDF